MAPVRNTGVYVPGGKAVYPSSVIMNAVPAQVAGVQRVVMATPALPDGSINPAVLVAARELAGLLLRLVRGELVDRATSDAVLAILGQTQHDSLIRRYLPAAKKGAHKTGSLNTARNNAPIIWADHAILAVVTAASDPDTVTLLLPLFVTTAAPGVTVSDPLVSATVTVNVSPAVSPLSLRAPPGTAVA